MRRTVAVVVGTAVCLLVAANGSTSAAARSTSFAGSCAVQGTVSFDPPVTLIRQELHVVYDADGTCTGSLNGRQVSHEPVSLHHSARSQGSCLGARTTSPGTGTIAFGDTTVVPYSFSFEAIGTEVFFAFSGQRSGEATGHGTFITSRTPADVALKCAGAGDALLPMDLTLHTSTPLVSRSSPR